MTSRRNPSRTGRGRGDTPGRILDTAERLVQTRGFNAFSYADVARELGITKPALHYHYAGKAELGEALVARYAARFARALADIDARSADAPRKLSDYVELYRRVLAEDRMCMCGMLAAEFDTLPDPVRDEVVAFFDRNEAWLADVLEHGRADGTLRLGGSNRASAQMIIGALEGAMLVARTYRDPERFEAPARRLLDDLLAPRAT